MSPAPSRPASRFWRNTQGGTAIEFAIVAPVFFLCALAFIQVGYGIYAQSTISQLAEKGARHLLFANDDIKGAEEVILAGLAGTPLDPGHLTMSAQRLSQPYSHVQLTLNYVFVPPGIPLPRDIILRSVVLVPVSK